MEEKQSLGHLAALFTVVNWGTTFIATKILLRTFAPVEILLLRFVLGYGTLWLACPRRQKVGDWKKEKYFIAAGLTGVCLYYLLENIALTFSTASNIGVIGAVSPLFTALLAMLISRGKEKLKLTFFLGFMVSIAGICLISWNGLAFSSDLRGEGLAIVSALVWACYSLLTRKIGGFGWNVIQTTRRIFGWGILFMLPCAVGMGFRWKPEALAEPLHIGLFLYLGLGACAACFVTWNLAIQILGPIKTMVYIYLVPVITVVCSVLILKEVVTPLAAAGTGMTLAGLVVSQWDSLKQLRTAGAAGAAQIKQITPKGKKEEIVMEKPTECSLTWEVTDEMTAKRIGSAGSKILSTPNMVALMEAAALELAKAYLDEGMTTVGAEIHCRHLAPTPVGMKVTATARLRSIERRKMWFGIEVNDEKGKCGEGSHLRIMVAPKGIQEKAEQKQA